MEVTGTQLNSELNMPAVEKDTVSGSQGPVVSQEKINYWSKETVPPQAQTYPAHMELPVVVSSSQSSDPLLEKSVTAEGKQLAERTLLPSGQLPSTLASNAWEGKRRTDNWSNITQTKPIAAQMPNIKMPVSIAPNTPIQKGFVEENSSQFKPVEEVLSQLKHFQQQTVTSTMSDTTSVLPRNRQSVYAEVPDNRANTSVPQANPSLVLTHPLHSLLPKVTFPVAISTQALQLMTNTAVTHTSVEALSTAIVESTASGCHTKPSSPVISKLPSVVAPVELSSSGSTSQSIPDLLKGKVDAKLFPPRHYTFAYLQIGTWKVEKTQNNHTLSVARLKVIFTQRKFVYEFQTNPDDLKGLCEGYKQMACVEVPFSSVVGININNSHEVLIEVDSAPVMYTGKQALNFRGPGGGNLPAKYDLPRDLTSGQLLVVPYHRVKLSTSTLKDKLSMFDPRFAALMVTPIQVDENKRLTSQLPVRTPQKKRVLSPCQEAQPESAKKPCPPTVKPAAASADDAHPCHCAAGCLTKRCTCIKNGLKCYGCKCTRCENPLNILADAGVDISAAKNDACLIQNISKVKDLKTALMTRKIEFPCCGTNVPFKEACVGTVSCPDCEGEYRYSWCWHDLCDEENRPRNHCRICKSCRDYRDDHCPKCNKCYFAGLTGYPCPCGEQRSFLDCLGAFMFSLSRPWDDSDDDDDY